MQVSPPTQFLQTFQQMRGQWFAAVQGPAQTLFGLLAVIEFAWSAAVLALERTDLQSRTAGLIRKLMWIGAFYALLVFGPTWIPAIVDSFTQLGQQASGVGPLQPGAVFQRGLDIGGALFGGASDAGFLSNFGTAMAMVFAAIMSFVAFCFISIQLVAALVESYIVVAAAFFFLGFGGSRWSAPYVEKYIALAVGVGVKIMILFLLIGVGMALSAGWVAVAKTVATSPNPAMSALDIVGESVIFSRPLLVCPEDRRGSAGRIAGVYGRRNHRRRRADRVRCGNGSARRSESGYQRRWRTRGGRPGRRGSSHRQRRAARPYQSTRHE
jgi:type IV secretion system protein TrbL